MKGPAVPIASKKPKEGDVLHKYLKTLIILSVAWFGKSLMAYTANRVHFEFMQTGQYRVIVNYTIPELKEVREAYVIFNKKSEASKFYWSLVRGGDFFPSDPKNIRFIRPKLEPRPW